MLKRLAFVCGLLGLVSCAERAAKPQVAYVAVDRPRAVSCVPKALPPAPSGLEDRGTLLALPEGPERYVRMTADWLARVARMVETEPVVRTCREAAPPP